MKLKLFRVGLTMFVALLFVAMQCDTPQPPGPDPGPDPVDTASQARPLAVLNKNVADYRPGAAPGYFPPAEIWTGAPSRYSEELPELKMDWPSNTYIISRGKIRSWSDVPFADQNYVDFWIVAGDYTDLGPLILPDHGRKVTKMVRYVDQEAAAKGWIDYPGMHARGIYKSGKSAILEGLEVGDRSTKKGASNWTIHKVTFAGKSWDKKGVPAGIGWTFFEGSKNITIDSCYVYRWKGGKIYGDSILIQGNIFEGNLRERGDFGAPGIFATTNRSSTNVKVIGNIFAGAGSDLLGVPKDGIDATSEKFVDGLIIAGNRFFWQQDGLKELDGVTYNCGGDGIDIKNGSSDPANPVIIENNLFFYVRPTPPDRSCGDNTGTPGQAIVTHKDARNLIIRGNVFADCSNGIVCRPGHTKDMDSRNIAISNNLFYNVGNALALNAPDIDVYQNTIVGAERVLSEHKDGKERLSIGLNLVAKSGEGFPASRKSLTVESNEDVNSDHFQDLHLQLWPFGDNRPGIVLPNAVPSKAMLKDLESAYPGKVKYKPDSWLSKYNDNEEQL